MKSTIVIGGGLMGSATAWQLTQMGEPVILLEQQDSIYTSGSSKGEARISRSLGPVDDIYAYLQMRGILETEKLINFLNSIDSQTHSMEDIYTTSPVTYIFYPESSDEVAVFNLDNPDTLAENIGDSIVLAENAEAIRERFDLDVPDSLKVIREYRKYSGTMNPRELIRKLHLAISYAGGEVRYNQKVKNLHRTDEGYELTISDVKSQSNQKLTTPRIVAAAGPYNGKVVKNISPAVDRLITPKRLFLTFLKIKSEVYNRLSETEKRKLSNAFPVIKLHSELFYSMIERNDADSIPIIKVGGHFKRTSISNLDKVWEIPVNDEEISWSIKETLDYLQMNGFDISEDDLAYHNGYSCVYSLTNSEVPYVTNLPHDDGSLDSNAVLVGGMSGVGAKGSMTYGQMAASLLLGQNESSDRMYQLTQKAIGNERMKHDLKDLPLD